VTTVSTAMLSIPVGRRDHFQGPATAPITLVEYGDYECSYCGQAHFIVKNLQERLGEQLRFVFRNFPLTTAHPHAQHAAEAAEAAGAQHRFWEMHDTLYGHQKALSDRYLKGYASQIGLDLGRLNLEMVTHRYAVRIREDFLGGVRSGVNDTPTFFINDVRHYGSHDLNSLLAAIEEAA
jgi:protein-disulfide isomerase